MKISVCMPCYNAVNFVDKSLECVLAQDHPDVEIIVANDGSTDGSMAVLSQYAGRGVTVLDGPNRGASSARNAAFRASSGDAVLFMDCDDLIPTNHLSALAALLDGPHVIAMGQWDRFYEEPNETTFPHRPTYEDSSGVDWLARGGWSMMQSAMFLIPRQHIDEYGSWNETRSPIDDFEFFTRMISQCAGLRFAPEAKVFYRSGLPSSLSRRRSRVYVEGKFSSLMLGTGHLLTSEDSPRTRRACANVLQSFDYEYYPHHADLREKIRTRVAELGGADIEPSGPPGFQRLRPLLGWRAARHVQHAAELLGLNGASRKSRRAPSP